MAIKVNARETELKFGKEATYHSAMIWKMKQIRRFLRHKKGTQIPWITQIWSQEWLYHFRALPQDFFNRF